MRHPTYGAIFGGAFSVLILAGCNSGAADLQSPYAVPDGSLDGVGPTCDGGACLADGSVRTCDGGGSCLTPGSVTAGKACMFTADCAANLYCGSADTCVPAGDGGVGAQCTTTGDCVKGAVCYVASGGLFGACSAPVGTTLPAASDGGDGGSVSGGKGTAQGIGGSCTTVLDCLAGLACNATSKTCEQGVPGVGLPAPWPGVTCTDTSPDAGTSPITAYFELPAADGTPPNDFFRLPFPNDVRRNPSTGRINLTGFPHPGTALLGFDIVERYATQSETDLDGFGTNQFVYFRFSGAVDEGSLTVGPGGSVQMIDLTVGAVPDSVSFFSSTGGNQYICGNNLKVTAGTMMPGHTYAVTLSSAIRDTTGKPVQPDTSFGPMLAASAPTGATLASAYAAFAPLRAYLKAQSINPDTIIDGTVFTTQHAVSEMPAIRTAVLAQPAPLAEGFVLCGSGAKSPCDDGLTGADHVRGCVLPTNPAFDELQGQLTIPIMQAGTRPYTTLGEGAIELDSSGAPVVQGTENVCVSITVPHGVAAPKGGWPVVVYAHGTGGFYRSGILEGLAGALTDVALPGGTSAQFAFLGYDGVMTGPRQGSGPAQNPDTLFFNFANPVAARDNVLQGGADLFALVRAMQTVSLPMLPTATDTTTFDPKQIYFVGHSQGSTVGLPASAFEPGLAGMVFSGAGGDLRDALLAKQNPVDLQSLTPYVLEDPAVDVTHPALNMFQAFIERADAENYGGLLLQNLPMGVTARPLVQTYGIGDTYAPDVTLQVVASAIGLDPVSPVPGPNPWPSPTGLTTPVTSNVMTASGTVTAALLEANPMGAYDGHFVLFDDPTLQKQVMEFLGTATTGTATIESP